MGGGEGMREGERETRGREVGGGREAEKIRECGGGVMLWGGERPREE
jgi:hypothetical protein